MLGDRVAVIRPGLVGQRMPVHGLVDGPVLRARDLDHEHVVRVVVRIEPARGRRGDVGVDLGGVTEVRDQLPGERRDGLPCAVQALEDQRRTAGELLEHLRRVELIGDLGAEAARAGERVRGESIVPSAAMRTNGVRRARSVMSSSAALALKRSSKPSGSRRRSGCSPQWRSAKSDAGRPVRRASAGRSLGPRSAASFKRIRRRRRRDPPRWLRRLRVLRLGSADPSAPPSWPPAFAPPSAGPSPVSAEPSAPPSWPPGSAPPSAGPSPLPGRTGGDVVVVDAHGATSGGSVWHEWADADNTRTIRWGRGLDNTSGIDCK